ncbi:alpha/beta-hydrolase [Microthyrium microscopicum]|uniref:Alpha/beta-hydrolase n=1 Tax=Microthyrium microscopicum TaxID=703497 RepID=A0A6A6U9W8_9PEZI|nr:alpha/beta-hydrolase [Microthyrium microscopicum]
MVNSLYALAFASSLLAGASAAPSPAVAFDPWSYQKKFVTCNAEERAANKSTPIKLKLAYLDINPTAKKTLVMAHGWPSMWTTYRHQIAEFGKDYRLIIPEHRGFGDSQHPKSLDNSNTMGDFVNDIICMMDDAKVSQAPCIGNDFGAQVCWEAGRARPDRFNGVFNVGIPYVSAGIGFTPNSGLAKLNKFFGYQVYLSDHPYLAAVELDDSPRWAIRSCAQVADSQLPADFLTKTDTFLGPWRQYVESHQIERIPFSGIMTQEVEDYMVESYKKQGFYNTFNGYQMGNRKRTYDHEVAQGNYTLSVPTFALYPTRDPVSNWEDFAKQVKAASFLKNHYNTTIATAHWPHEEKPEEFNRILRQWLGNVTYTA